MKKITFISIRQGLFLVGAAFAVTAVYLLYSSAQEVKFVGTIERGGSSSCLVDGVCTFNVSGVQVIWSEGWKKESRGSVNGTVRLGTAVEVYGKKINDSLVTIYGKRDYYVNELVETAKFSGSVEAIGQSGCLAMGVCSIIVDDIEIIYAEGFNGDRAKGIEGLDLKIGTKIEVYGKKIGERTVTALGDESYYIKFVAE